MKPAAPSPDADRDAWLSQALRHAPDADVAAPPSLSEMILREAQAKSKPAGAAAPQPAAPFWSRAWDWMARPAVGAGAASVMLASLVGVMMWNRPLEEMSPRPKLDTPTAAPAPAPAPVPSAADAASASGAAGTSAAVPAKEQAPTLHQATPSAAPTAPSLSADGAARRERLSDAAKASKPADAAVSGLVERKRELLEQQRAVEAERRAEPSRGAAVLRDDKQRATLRAPPDAMAKAARTAESMSPAPPVVEAVAPMAAAAPASPAAMPPPPPPLPVQVAGPAPAAAPTATEQAQTANIARSTPAPSAQVAQPSRQAAVASAPPAARFAAGGLSTAPAERSFVNLRAGLAAEPTSWRWSRDGTAPRNVDDSLSAFLAEVDSVATNRWQSAPAGLADASTNGRMPADSAVARDKLSASATATVRLLRNGQLVHLLRLDGNVLHWDRLGANPASATVTLTDAELQSVRRALDKLAP